MIFFDQSQPMIPILGKNILYAEEANNADPALFQNGFSSIEVMM